MSPLEFLEQLAYMASHRAIISELIDGQSEIIKKAFANNDAGLLISTIAPNDLQQANHAFVVHI